MQLFLPNNAMAQVSTTSELTSCPMGMMHVCMVKTVFCKTIIGFHFLFMSEAGLVSLQG
jgi:hypothetical protein